jgi:Domain of unknown function (DUF4407)
MEDYKIDWLQVPSWMRFGLKVARVQKPLVTSGELSPNEIENLAKFGYICIAVTVLAVAEMYCFARYALGASNIIGYISALVWGVMVLTADRSLFRDKLDKAKIRVALIIFATLILSLGFSVLISDAPITDKITEENRKSNEMIDKSLLANLQPYQDRLDKALESQNEIGQGIAKNTNTTEAIKQATVVQSQAAQYAGDTSASGKRMYKSTNNALYTINQGLKKQENTEKGLQDATKKTVQNAQIALDSQRVRYQQAYNLQRQPPDYSESNKSLTLLRNYIDVGWLHIFVLLFIAFIEMFPLMMRTNYRDYDAVQLMIGLGNTPMREQTQRIKTIRADIEEAKRMREEERNNPKNVTDTVKANDNPFNDVF